MLYNQGVASNKMLEEGFLLYCIIPCRYWIRTVFVFCEKLKSCINTQNTWWEPRYHSTFPEGYFPIHRNELHGNSALVLFPFIDILCLNIFFTKYWEPSPTYLPVLSAPWEAKPSSSSKSIISFSFSAKKEERTSFNPEHRVSWTFWRCFSRTKPGRNNIVGYCKHFL